MIPAGTLAAALLSIALATQLEPPHPLPATPLPEFILGAWEATSPSGFGAAGAPAYFQVNFIDSDTLSIDVDAPEAQLGLQFEYAFIQPKRIHLSARVADDWDLRPQGERLLITSREWLHDGGTVSYSRVPVPNWPIMALGVCLLLFTLVVVPLPHKPARLQTVPPPSSLAPTRSLPWLIGSGLLAFGIGILLGPFTFPWVTVTSIRPPWSHILLLILALSALLVGVRLMIAANSGLFAVRRTNTVLLSSLGAFFAGVSIIPLASTLFDLAPWVLHRA